MPQSNFSSKLKKVVKEWGIILGIIMILYVTGLHTEVIGRFQQAILWTGVLQADTQIPDKEIREADYSLSLVSLEGKRISLAEFKGKVLFMNYWATWCSPCIAEMPNIQALYEDFESSEGIEFVMISLDDSMNKAKEFIERKEFTFPVYMLAEARPAVYQSSIIPTTYIINKKGEIVSMKKGMANYNTGHFRKFVHSLLDESE